MGNNWYLTNYSCGCDGIYFLSLLKEVLFLKNQVGSPSSEKKKSFQKVFSNQFLKKLPTSPKSPSKMMVKI